jgi:hypothetical protein
MMDEKKKQHERIRMAYRNVFSHPDAWIVLKDLDSVVGFFDVMFLGERREWLTPEQAAHKDGMRRVLLRILRFSGLENEMREAMGKRYER